MDGGGTREVARDDGLVVECRVYTHARRHPVVIGNIQGLRIPPVTPAQLLVGVGSLVFLTVSYRIWAHFGGALNSVIMLGVPLGLAFAARALRVEGRAPWRAAFGWLMLVASPKRGMRLGKPERNRTLIRRYRNRVWMAEVTYR
ncbi:MAG TPA: hypothetical protein VGJ86_22315 [Acidimicrobiales bacterium]|jgi:hypothetical protein